MIFHRATQVGVAAFNTQCGAETINSLFRLGGGSDAFQPLDGPQLDSLVDALEYCKLLVINEVGMVGSEQLAQLSMRLAQVSEQCGGSGGDFGGVSVIAVGDFGQTPPIKDSSLIGSCSTMPPRFRSSAAKQRAIAFGRRLFSGFQSVFRLRRVHRQSGVCPFKESGLRVRDGAQTVADHGLWQTHDISKGTTDPAFKQRTLTEFKLIAAEHRTVGEWNGEQAAAMASTVRRRDPSASGASVLRIRAVHNDPAAADRSPEDCKQLRSLVHLVIGAPVMLLLNGVWGKRAVLAS